MYILPCYLGNKLDCISNVHTNCWLYTIYMLYSTIAIAFVPLYIKQHIKFNSKITKITK